MDTQLQLSVVVGQFPISLNLTQNLQHILKILQQAKADELVVLPEGAVSGYSDDLAFLNTLDTDQLTQALDRLAETVVERKLHLIVGSLIWEKGKWWNAGIYFAPDGQRSIYRKVNLAYHERAYLAAGDRLPVFPMQFEHGQVKVGIQLCREIRYPEQWRYLASQNIDLFVYLTYTINPKESLGVWRSHLVSRAAENQRFLLSANVAHPDQNCPTMIIAPNGEILNEASPKSTSVLRATLDLRKNSDWYLNQSRTDVIALTYNKY